jgi:hypothetical protein
LRAITGALSEEMDGKFELWLGTVMELDSAEDGLAIIDGLLELGIV